MNPNMAVFRPMPHVSVSTAIPVNNGSRRSLRARVAQVLPGAGQRPLVRHAGRERRLPARLGQRAQARREQIGALELGERERRRRLVVGAARHQRLAAILEMLGQLVEDRRLARRRQMKGGEARPELGLPVTHDHPR